MTKSRKTILLEVLLPVLLSLVIFKINSALLLEGAPRPHVLQSFASISYLIYWFQYGLMGGRRRNPICIIVCVLLCSFYILNWIDSPLRHMILKLTMIFPIVHNVIYCLTVSYLASLTGLRLPNTLMIPYYVLGPTLVTLVGYFAGSNPKIAKLLHVEDAAPSSGESRTH